MFQVIYARSARKELKRLPVKMISAIIEKTDALANDPRPRGSKKLKGYKNSWRIRIGDYRVIYRIEDKVRIVRVTNIGHRGEIYD